jgi:hypothetical protein
VPIDRHRALRSTRLVDHRKTLTAYRGTDRGKA